MNKTLQLMERSMLIPIMPEMNIENRINDNKKIF